MNRMSKLLMNLRTEKVKKDLKTENFLLSASARKKKCNVTWSQFG